MFDVRCYESPMSVLTVMTPVQPSDHGKPGLEWYGYEETSSAPVARTEPASSRIVLILERGDPISVGSRKGELRHLGGFVAGLDDVPTSTCHAGHQAGIQLNLSPAMAHTLFRMPLAEVARQVIPADDVLPDAWRRLLHRLRDSDHDWPAHMAMFSHLVNELTADESTPRSGQWRVLQWILDEIHRAQGDVRVQHLVRETGWSMRRLQRTFAAEIGMSPKRYARLIRFEALCSRLRQEPDTSLADAAESLGYFDQPHLTRDVTAFAGVSPVILAKRLQAGF